MINIRIVGFEKNTVEQYNIGVDVTVGIYEGFSIKVQRKGIYYGTPKKEI